MTTPTERAFAFFARGQVRDEIILLNFRLGLAKLIDPETGDYFTADKIAQATQQGSRWWIEADSIDLMGMAIQSRDMLMADQVRIDRANHNWLVGYHGDLWGKSPLPASPGSGTIRIKATPGATYVGSTTLPDPTATTFRDAAGLRYQVLTTVVTDGTGVAELTLIGIDTGDATNIKLNAVVTIDQNPPLGTEPTGVVINQDFSGGLPDESDADFQARIRADVRHKPGAGNNAQFRSWARESTTAIKDAFIYACAMQSGSTLVCVTQKRGSTPGPNALVAVTGTLLAARGYLVPPNSPVVPARVFVVVTTFTPRAADTIIQLAQVKGNNGGWKDPVPWPGVSAFPAAIVTVTNQTTFRMHSDTTLPTATPALMVWDVTKSRFEALRVASVVDATGGNFDVVLQEAPAKTLAVDDWLSPEMLRRDTVAVAAEEYFDGLGPGEVVDLTIDTRADRAARFPDPAEEFPSRGGQALVTAISDALGATVSAGQLFSMSPTTPQLPSDVVDGPGKLTLGKLAVYDLP